jgi:hypothetical protein
MPGISPTHHHPPRFAVLLLATLTTFTAPADVPLDIGSRNQVFIDGRFLASSENVRIVTCQPIKTNEVSLRGKLGGYSTLIKPREDFLWYSALSKDGIHWRRVGGFNVPEADDILGILLGGTTVFEDPKAPPAERFKRLDGMRNRMSASPNGKDWTVLREGIFPAEATYPHGMDSHNVCYFDEALGKYVAYVRVNKVYTCPPERVPYFRKIGTQRYGGKNKYSRRAIGRSVSDDPTSFPMPEVVMAPDARDPTFGGVKVMDFYCPQVVPYPGAQDAYFLFNTRYRSYEDWYLAEDMSVYTPTTVGVYNVGAEDIALAASRDGVAWERYERRPWIRNGLAGSKDALGMYMTRGMHVQGDEIWMYYIGIDDPHTGDPDVQDKYVLSRVVLRKDGLTCVEAPYDGGEFTTPAMRFEGDALYLNIDTSGVGLARVEIQDDTGAPLPGFALEDCDRIHATNVTKFRVTWGGNSDLGALAGNAIRLRVELQFGTRLYAFRFGHAT